ncbi:EAL domain-containing protein [Fundidesulfovibrio butyratiphilus]
MNDSVNKTTDDQSVTDKAPSPSRDDHGALLNDAFLSCFPADLAQVLARLRKNEQGEIEAPWRNMVIRSVFQPIVSFTHNCIIGHEALVRPALRRGAPISPPDFFALAQKRDELTLVDRACRALHLLNAGNYPGWLFLNFHPALFGDPRNEGLTERFLSAFVDVLGVNPGSIVVEVVENKVPDEERFDQGVKSLRDANLSIALDDFGVGDSNFSRIWSVRPEIIKLDRSFADQSEKDIKVRKVLPSLVAMLHEMGTRVLLEGIETEQQALIALESNVDFGQGWFFARPASSPLSDPYALAGVLDSLWSAHCETLHTRERDRKEFITPFTQAIEVMSGALQRGVAFEEAGAAFLNIHEAKRLYIVDNKGFILEPAMRSSCRAAEGKPCVHCNGGCPSPTKKRFNPLPDNQPFMKLARLAMQPFFRRAVEAPNTPQITRPYVSPCDGKLTVTVSIGFSLDGALCVLCGDLDWSSLIHKL